MNIGMDIDDVIADFVNPIIDFYYKKTGIRLLYEDFFTYTFEKVWGGTSEEAIAIVKEFYHTPEFANLPLIDGAKEGLRLLNEEHNLVFVTSRHAKAREVTPGWIRERLPELQDKRIIYSGEYIEDSDVSKADICEREGLDVMVEDGGKCALDCSERGIRTILFDRRWNEGYSHPHRVYDWFGVMRKIGSFDGQI